MSFQVGRSKARDGGNLMMRKTKTSKWMKKFLTVKGDCLWGAIAAW